MFLLVAIRCFWQFFLCVHIFQILNTAKYSPWLIYFRSIQHMTFDMCNIGPVDEWWPDKVYNHNIQNYSDLFPPPWENWLTNLTTPFFFCPIVFLMFPLFFKILPSIFNFLFKFRFLPSQNERHNEFPN